MRTSPVSLAVGVLATALGWEIIGRTRAFGTSWASLSSVIAYALPADHRVLLLDAAARTGGEALAALLLGAGAGMAVASLAALVPRLAPGLTGFAGLVNGIPVIAVAGLCALTLPSNATPVVVAALAAGFIVFVAASAGFASASPAQHDLFAVLGATRSATFARLLVPNALPELLDGVRSAAPSAVVGAIIGEWFSAEQGLGPLLVAAMQNYDIEQLWAAALSGALLSICAYAVLGAVRDAIQRRISC